jgi:hypothetical protein
MLSAFAWILGAYLFVAACVAVALIWAGYPDSKLKMAAIWPYALVLTVLDWWRNR